MRTHAFIIIDGPMRDKACYVPADQLLKEMRGQFPGA
jgi:hypothetical protein